MMTIQQARVFVGQQIGLPQTFDGSVAAYRELTQAQQTALTAQLINYIVNNPGQFTPAQVTTANAEKGRINSLGTVDASFDWQEFFTALGDEAVNVVGTPLQNVGQGVSNLVSFLGKATPFIVIGGALLVGYLFLRKEKLVS